MDTVSAATIYAAPSSVADAAELAAWLGERCPSLDIAVADRFLETHRDEDLPTAFARARVLSPYDRETGNEMLGIVRYEERALEHPEREGGVLYDGLAIQNALASRIDREDQSIEHAHIILLDRAIATWGDHDGRWHKRVCVLGQPSIISIPGLYEAPAKPEAYYKEQQKQALLSGDTPPREVLENQVEGDFLIENDPRTTDALKGYVLAAVDYLETGEGFCEEPQCRLSNPHRQPELIDAQLREPEFCDRHAEMYGH